MTNNANNVVVGANGTVYVAATSASAPTTVSSVLTGFTELGYVTEDGATWTDGKEITDIHAWQELYPIRKLITAKTSTLAFGLREWRAKNVILAFGGGTVASVSGGYSYTPPSATTLDSRSLILDWQDGSKNYRLYFPTGIVSENVETHLTRSDSAVLAITFAATPSGTQTAYKLFTDDPAWADYSL